MSNQRSHLPGQTVWRLTPPIGTRFVNEMGSTMTLMFPIGQEAAMLAHLRAWCDDIEAGRNPMARGILTDDKEAERQAHNAKLGLSDGGVPVVPPAPSIVAPAAAPTPAAVPVAPIPEPLIFAAPPAAPPVAPSTDPVGDAIRAAKAEQTKTP